MNQAGCWWPPCYVVGLQATKTTDGKVFLWVPHMHVQNDYSFVEADHKL